MLARLINLPNHFPTHPQIPNTQMLLHLPNLPNLSPTHPTFPLTQMPSRLASLPNHFSTHPQIPQYPNRPLNPTSLTVLLHTPFPHVPQKPPPSAPRTPAPAPCITGGEGGAARDGGASKSCWCDASTCLLMRYSHAKLRGGQVSGGGGR